ncbi:MULTISPECIES: AAA family ATPase [Cupriavidus]|uniref:ATPase n=3 Tax=Cupriavidus TaxID=106589 RepID=A0A375GS12_9BURK|nr:MULTISPECIES: SMC family ATPase [Cupriavidus]MCO4865873.1 SMC family ATPase [Cupriavidus sp. WGlv3]MCO4893370.1 SMC family ATPase [Cupriavidus sp. WGtm5]ULX56064.1 nuclease SbcCD subunit C [Cupriavidus taiwanensis]CAP63840.1 putative ATPase [Cupriavidus taiwanensis LMG 19424]SOY74014.1 putative ATPase [Cupriavidus taiwanensis]
MRPLKLTLAGFHGIRDGMQRDSITVDLSSLPAGLIAIVGPNGAGKTTIMDNLHPYPIMPSHAAKMSADAFSYWDHLCAPRGEKDLEWEHGGKIYRSAFAFRNPGKSRKAEYYLFEKVGGDWKPVQLADGTLSDGKAETYGLCLEAVLGSAEAFFTSVFSAQNRRPLTTYQPAEIKKLLAELLGIDHLRELSAKAGDVAKALNRALETVQRDVLVLSGKRDTVNAIAQEICQIDEGLDAERARRAELLTSGSKLEQERATLAAKQAASAGTEARLRELDQRHRELTGRRQQLAGDARAAASKASARRQDLQRLAAEHRSTLAQAEAIKAAAHQRDEAQLALGRHRGELDRLQKELADLEPVAGQHAAIASELRGMESRGSVAAQLVKTLKAQTEVMDQVPCAGHDMHARCPLLAQAREAKGKLEPQVIEVANLRTSYKAKQEALQQLGQALARLNEVRRAVAALRQEVEQGNSDLQRLTGLAAKKPLLDASAAALDLAQRDLVTLDAEDTERKARLDRDIRDVDTQLASLQRERDSLAVTDVTGLVADLDRRLAASREAVSALDGRIESLIRRQSALATERSLIERELAGLDGLESRVQRLSDEIAQWKLLAKGLGNDGVIALSIDDAGPAITAMVNDLLLACYGRRFTVAIQTQTKLANGDAREGFAISVLDADNGTTKDFSVLSGGQKVWINECLTRGIALYRAQDTQQPFQTLFTDEADGPLDPERKRAFMQMKREVLRLGGYEREFFISQTPDLVDEADAVIDVVALAAL